MKKIWITRKELRQLVREEFPDDDWGEQVPPEAEKRLPTPAPGRPAPFPRHPQSASLEPDPNKTQTIRMRSPNPRVGRPPEKRQARIGVARGGQSRGRLVPSGQRDPSAKQPYTRDELSQGADVNEPSEVMPAGKSPKVSVVRGRHGGRSRLAPSGGRDTSAQQPYTRDELRQGADVDRGTKQPGVLDRLKQMFLRKRG